MIYFSKIEINIGLPPSIFIIFLNKKLFISFVYYFEEYKNYDIISCTFQEYGK